MIDDRKLPFSSAVILNKNGEKIASYFSFFCYVNNAVYVRMKLFNKITRGMHGDNNARHSFFDLNIQA